MEETKILDEMNEGFQVVEGSTDDSLGIPTYLVVGGLILVGVIGKGIYDKFVHPAAAKVVEKLKKKKVDSDSFEIINEDAEEVSEEAE